MLLSWVNDSDTLLVQNLVFQAHVLLRESLAVRGVLLVLAIWEIGWQATRV